MKQKNTLFLLLLFLPVFYLTAQTVTVSPIPQFVKWEDKKAFDNTNTFSIVASATADEDALQLLNQRVQASQKGIKIVIGKRGDTLLADYNRRIPNKKEGYYLKIDKDKIIVAGNDDKGTFYAVQSLLQILSQPEVMQVEIADFPDMPNRGAIEGFYGNPWSHKDRLRLFDFMGANKMDIFVYSPKDDPYHKDKWAEPYPKKLATQLSELVAHAHKNKVKFVWAVHIGAKGVTNQIEYDKLLAKFENMYALGVRYFAVFYDDFGNETASQQCATTNYMVKNFIEKKDDVGQMLFCPTGYNKAWASREYLTTLGKEMDESVMIYWTGNTVVDMINFEDMRYINQYLNRKAFIWLNYPVTDYCIEHLLMGRTYGNDKTIANMVSGFTSNPMEYCEASKLSLYSIADYTWNTQRYNSQKSWIRAMKNLQPNTFDAFKVFCENNIDLGVTTHRLRREGESEKFKINARQFKIEYNNKNLSKQAISKIRNDFQTFCEASQTLMTDTYNPALIEEIKPWLDVFHIMGQKGQLFLDMYAHLQSKDSLRFIQDYLAVKDLMTKQKAVRARDFEGSIKSPNPEPANEVVAPFIKWLQSQVINDYKKNFTYCTDVFPIAVIEDGSYYIKVNGLYLTNSLNNKKRPILLAEKDIVNPQRQEWNISLDFNTERFSIINAQDKVYINELGLFGRNPYEAVWHTYVLHNKEGKFAIQNGGNAGDKFWTIDENILIPTKDNKMTDNKFIFELIPIE